MKLSIMVTRRVKLAMDLEGALAAHAEEAAAGLGEFFVPALEEDGTVLDAATLLDGLRRKVVWWRERLTGLDLANQEEVSERQRWRDREAAQTMSLYDLLVSMRRITRGLLTEQDLLRLGLAGAVAQDPVKVLRQSEKTWKRFQSEPESAEGPGLWAQLMAMAARLGPDVKGLTKSVKEVRRARRKVESSAARKRQAIKDFDRQYLWIAKTAEMLFRMAGLEEAADRVKPQARRLDRDAGGGGGAAVDGEGVGEKDLTVTAATMLSQQQGENAGSAGVPPASGAGGYSPQLAEESDPL